MLDFENVKERKAASEGRELPDEFDVMQVKALVKSVVENGVGSAEAAGSDASGRGVLREVKRVAAMGALECVNCCNGCVRMCECVGGKTQRAHMINVDMSGLEWAWVSGFNLYRQGNNSSEGF